MYPYYSAFQMHVSFRVNVDLLNMAEVDSPDEGITVRVEESESNRILRINHHLQIQYNNGTSQVWVMVDRSVCLILVDSPHNLSQRKF